MGGNGFQKNQFLQGKNGQNKPENRQKHQQKSSPVYISYKPMKKHWDI